MEQLLILRDLAVIFGASLLVVLVFHRMRLAALPGFIVAGVLLGPNALGFIPDVHRVEGLAEVGVILLLFTIGIEFSLGRLREMGRQVVVAGACQVGLTVAATAAVAVAGAARWQVALFLGFLAALSSTAIVLKLLTEKGDIDTPHGRLGTEAVGASLALGAFLAGLVISESDYAHQAMAELLPFRDIFISLFFVAVGMLVQLDVVLAHPGLTFAGVAVLLSGKTLIAAVGPALLGYSARVALLAGLAVSQIGEFSFVIAGLGLNGRNLATALRAIRVPYLIVELNPQTVRQARAQGEPAFYGDATREEILRALGLERAKLFVVAISDPAATRRMVRVARGLNPALHIIARTRYVVEIPELARLGANVVIPEEFETSIEIFTRVLSHYEVPQGDIDTLVNRIRASHYQALRVQGPFQVEQLPALSGLPQMTAECVRLPPGAKAVGRSLAATRLRTRTGALVLSIRRGDEDIPTPDPRLPLAAGDELSIVGQPQQLRAARELLIGEPPQPGQPSRS